MRSGKDPDENQITNETKGEENLKEKVSES